MNAIPDLPALAPWYRVAGEGERLVFEHAHRAVVLDGAAVRTLLPRLLPLLDGTRTVAEIADALGIPPEPAVVNALRVLAERRLLVGGAPGPIAGERSAAAELAAAAGLSPAAVAASLDAARVAVAGNGGAADAVVRLLADSGIGRVEQIALVEAPHEGDLLVAAPTHEEVVELVAVNDRALAAARAWLQVLPHDGRIVAVGPLFLPGETACRACFALRRNATLGYGDAERLLDGVPLRASASPALEAVAAGLAATLALRWLGCRDPRVPGILFAVETEQAPRVTTHAVLRVPRCPACSAAARQARPAPWFDPAPLGTHA